MWAPLLELAALFLVWDVHFGVVSGFKARGCRANYGVEEGRHPRCYRHSCWFGARAFPACGMIPRALFRVPSADHDADGPRQWFSLTGDSYGVLLFCIGTP
jgi:hypothetical protein